MKFDKSGLPHHDATAWLMSGSDMRVLITAAIQADRARTPAEQAAFDAAVAAEDAEHMRDIELMQQW